jgi:hypothetical protein
VGTAQTVPRRARRRNVKWFQFLLLLVIMILILPASDAASRDYEQDHEQEQEYRSNAPAISTREARPFP